MAETKITTEPTYWIAYTLATNVVRKGFKQEAGEITTGQDSLLTDTTIAGIIQQASNVGITLTESDFITEQTQN